MTVYAATLSATAPHVSATTAAANIDAVTTLTELTSPATPQDDDLGGADMGLGNLPPELSVTPTVPEFPITPALDGLIFPIEAVLPADNLFALPDSESADLAINSAHRFARFDPVAALPGRNIAIGGLTTQTPDPDRLEILDDRQTRSILTPQAPASTAAQLPSLWDDNANLWEIATVALGSGLPWRSIPDWNPATQSQMGDGDDIVILSELVGYRFSLLHGGNGDDGMVAQFMRDGQGDVVEFYGDAGNDSIAGSNVTLSYAGSITTTSGTRLYGDLLDGGAGNDRLSGEDGDDLLRGGTGNDRADGGKGADTIFGGTGDDRLEGDDDDDYLDGGDGDDILHGDTGDDDMVGGDGGDLLDGGDGNDQADGGKGADFMFGSTGNDKLSGGDDDDQLNGDDGDDTIDGGNGDDIIDGGTGDDYILGGAGIDSLTGGADNDTLSYRNAAGSIGLDLIASSGYLGDASGDQFSGFEHVVGSDFNDLFISNATGFDIDGGAGKDSALFDNTGFGLLIDLRAGEAVDINDPLNAPVDRLSNIENVVGTRFADIIRGDDNDNELFGADGDDTISSGLGADTIYAGFGNDTASYADSQSAVQIDLSGISQLGGTAEGDMLIDIENVEGSDFNDMIVADPGANTLSGGKGDDELYGQDGNDILFGSVGRDRLFGGDGNDILYGGPDSNELHGGNGNDVFVARDGGDSTCFGDLGDDIFMLPTTPADGLLFIYGFEDNVDKFYTTGPATTFNIRSSGFDTVIEDMNGVTLATIYGSAGQIDLSDFTTISPI